MSYRFGQFNNLSLQHSTINGVVYRGVHRNGQTAVTASSLRYIDMTLFLWILKNDDVLLWSKCLEKFFTLHVNHTIINTKFENGWMDLDGISLKNRLWT